MLQSILILDENSQVQGLVQSALCSDTLKIEISQEVEAISFLERVKEVSPDLILISNYDQQNEYQIIKSIQATDEIQLIPILLLTSLKDQPDEEYLSTLGVKGFLQKPFEASVFQNQICTLFENVSKDVFKTMKSSISSAQKERLENVVIVEPEVSQFASESFAQQEHSSWGNRRARNRDPRGIIGIPRDVWVLGIE